MHLDTTSLFHYYFYQALFFHLELMFKYLFDQSFSLENVCISGSEKLDKISFLSNIILFETT